MNREWERTGDELGNGKEQETKLGVGRNGTRNGKEREMEWSVGRNGRWDGNGSGKERQGVCWGEKEQEKEWVVGSNGRWSGKERDLGIRNGRGNK